MAAPVQADPRDGARAARSGWARRYRWPAVVVVLLLAAGGGLLAWRTGLLGAPGPGSADPPHFVEEALAAGIDHAYAGGFNFFVGGGVAAFDCNGDGKQDLYLAGGEDPAALYRNDSSVGGALRFTAIHDAATDLRDVTGAYPIDIDGDGITDLAVLRLGENVLLRGLGDCRFQRANEAWGFDGGHDWSAAFSATWEAGASLPTLAVGNYLTLKPDGTTGLPCVDSSLFRPAAGGQGYAAPIPLSPGYCPLSMLFSDWNRSGHADLRVSNDRHYYGEASNGEEQLWRMQPGQPPSLYTAADGWQTVRVWGMGIASYDLTGDGYPEVYLTSQGDNKLQTLANGASRPDYTDIALKRGVTATRPYAGDTSLPSTAWHDEFADVNNDGRADLLVTKGNVDAMADFATRDPSDLMVQQPDGTFIEEAQKAGMVSYAKARGAAVADFNLDGMLDVVIVNRNQNVSLYRNVGWGDAANSAAMGHWIALRLRQPAPDSDAIGAWVTVTADGTTQTREITIGGGHASGELGWIHVGIGSATQATVTVTWPGGSQGPPLTVDANTFAIVDRGASEVTPWTPSSP
jgi:enediyne biosynthesis protein E4